MNQDETPIHLIIWQRFLKAMGSPPPMDEIEKTWRREAWINRITIVQAIVITTAVGSLVNADTITAAPILKAIRDFLPWYSTYPDLYRATGLMIVALLIPLAASWTLRCWRYCRHHNFLPIFVIVLVVAWYWSNSCPGSLGLGAWGCCILFFICICTIGWQRQEPDPVIVDDLQRDYFVERLLDLFQVPNATMKRIAVIGTWGTGKTTVLHLLRQRLKQSNLPEFGVALVNPWVAKSPEDMQRMLAEAFDEALGQPNYFASPWSRLPWLSWLTGFKAAAGFGLNFDLKQVFEGGSSLQEGKLIERINFDLRALNKTCVILVDDMERADPEIIRKMFPVINVLRGIESCFFVFAIDPDRIAKAFKEDEKGEVETKGYLDKVFDLQLPLPEPRNRDVAVMCRRLINPVETPKLASCFNRLGKHLPTNPRDAIRFMNDAKAKEALFLTRYDEKEKKFYPLFLLRLAELELPGITDLLRSEPAKNYVRRTREHASSHRDPHADENDLLGKVWGIVAKTRKLASKDEKRLKAVLVELLEMDDLEWASHHHMRLLTPTSIERLRLNEYWKGHVGKMSLEQMIPTFLPGRKFTDIQNAAHELVEATVEEYFTTREKIQTAPFEIDLAQARHAINVISNLRVHFQAAIENRWTFDLALFDAALFDHIGKVVCTPMPKNAELDNIIAEERSFHKELAQSLPFSEAYGRRMLSDSNLFEYWAAPNKDMSYCASHLAQMRVSLGDLIANSIFKWIEEDSYSKSWRQSGMMLRRELEPFQLPDIWIPNDRARRTLILERLAKTLQRSTSVSNLAIRALQGTLHQLTAWLNGSNVDDAKSHAAYFLDHHDFFTVIWRLHEFSDSEITTPLNKAKKALLEACGKHPHAVSAEQIEAILSQANRD